MADENSARYRLSDPLGRASTSAGQSNDPLAELARLIGRNDPFAELEREVRAASQTEQDPQEVDSAYAESHHSDSGYSRQPEPHPGDDLPAHSNDFAPEHGNDPPSHHGSHPVAGYEDDQLRVAWPRHTDSDPAYAADSLGSSSQRSPHLTAASNENQPYAEYPSDGPAFLRALYPQEPAAGSLSAPHDTFYDDAEERPRRKGLLTVAAVFALAVVGTAGAYGYRSFFGGANPASPPPVIRASAEPSKVAPPSQPVDQTASKFSYDRFGDRGQNEQVVVREEKPVENLQLGRTSVARAAPMAAAPPTTVSSAGQVDPNPPNPPSALGEPRRVRTVPIRPDQPDTAALPQSPPRQSAAPMPAAPVFPPVARQPNTVAPVARQPSTVVDAPANPRTDAGPPSGNTRPAPPRSNPRVAARNGGADENAPLSLSPETNTAPPPAMAAREPEPPRPAPAARAAAAAASGGFVVQVSSQRSEADAENSFRSIQAKFSSVLNGHRHLIRRADLGSKGVYYRAMVGPFGTRDQAVQLCVSLKTAGGDCVVQAN